ncbi:MAG: MtrAB system histidine kinase MtrB [Propionibacteriaceae bacterium]|nr:HAMP domain-containing histidine kinase [Micropruina sp.]HBX81234.1 two-component sensor histidine kinase [Propionibacteriaceae bacterium]HBY23536.1 two-component sensor histidine kinase [Propionibacteriaceae bacterium]
MRRLGGLFQVPGRLWARSLPFRVLSTTLALTVIVLLVTGWFLVAQSTQGIYQTKKELCLSEAASVLDGMQRQLSMVDTRTETVTERLTQLATDAAARGSVGAQYHVLVSGPVSDIASAALNPYSVPAALRSALETSDALLSTPTTLMLTDGRPNQPGLAVASVIRGPNNVRYPVYLIFSMTQEEETLAAVQRAAIASGVMVIVLLGVTGYFVALSVVRPVQAARRVAEQMSGGNLAVRMQVTGTEDLASLGSSMNHMAEEMGRKINQLESLSALQQRFVSDVSHELRTPLTTVRMAADVLDGHRDELQPVMARGVELMQTELGRFEELLGELLEISRFDAGAAVLATEEVDVVTLVLIEIDAVGALAAETGAEVVLDAPSTAIAEVDAPRVRRIIRNLLTNALAYGDGTDIQVSIRVDDQAVAVAVRDYGVGFTTAEAAQVFNRFWRADPARGRSIGGTGLGLSISLEDARLHGGWLHAWGRPGEGAQFRLTLPRHLGQELSASPWPVVPTDRVRP